MQSQRKLPRVFVHVPPWWHTEFTTLHSSISASHSSPLQPLAHVQLAFPKASIAHVDEPWHGLDAHRLSNWHMGPKKKRTSRKTWEPFLLCDLRIDKGGVSLRLVPLVATIPVLDGGQIHSCHPTLSTQVPPLWHLGNGSEGLQSSILIEQSNPSQP